MRDKHLEDYLCIEKFPINKPQVLTDSHVAENIILKVFESHGADFIKKYIDHSPDPTALNAGSAGGLGRGFSEKETGVVINSVLLFIKLNRASLRFNCHSVVSMHCL